MDEYNNDDDDEDWNEEENDDDQNYMEWYVILFNLWKHQGPQGVPPDYTTGSLPKGIALVDHGNDDDSTKQQEQLQAQEWATKYGPNCQ